MNSARLIAYTQPTPEFAQEWAEHPDLQDLVVYCARVSNPSNQTNQKTAEKLIRFLARYAHWSPFEMVSANLEIETTRDIAHQIVRHRSFAFQEFSQRYADPTKELAFVTREPRLQDTKNRQNSFELEEGAVDDNGRVIASEWNRLQTELIEHAQRVYHYGKDNGLAKEQIRAVLPEGLTPSRLQMNGSLRSWIHYIQLRSGNGTQKEHAEVARSCALEIARIFPMIHEYVTDPNAE